MNHVPYAIRRDEGGAAFAAAKGAKADFMVLLGDKLPDVLDAKQVDGSTEIRLSSIPSANHIKKNGGDAINL